MQKDILNKVVIKNRTDLVSLSYCIVVDIRESHLVFRKYARRTRVVNLYDNKIGEGYLWQGLSLTIKQAIQDIF